ncbi:unnamed protein product [Mytilus coruscus]|uniref:VWFA domain-containing protein n=1 Tax=Mytilus coruscus TaxID=42192 RepID=A0A6J8BIV1_MYTCO|nr:unnamed protein product [Mytilus coruscus]
MVGTIVHYQRHPYCLHWADGSRIHTDYWADGRYYNSLSAVSTLTTGQMIARYYSSLSAVSILTTGQMVACYKKKADVFFIVDTSSSLNVFENVKKELNFVADVILVNAFEVGSDQVRVGMMTFSNDPEMLFKLDDFKIREEIAKLLMEMNANYWNGR